jgi:hypothetical protein
MDLAIIQHSAWFILVHCHGNVLTEIEVHLQGNDSGAFYCFMLRVIS